MGRGVGEGLGAMGGDDWGPEARSASVLSWTLSPESQSAGKCLWQITQDPSWYRFSHNLKRVAPAIPHECLDPNHRDFDHFVKY